MIFFKRNNLISAWLPRLQSHRGYCGSGLQENTLSSIQRAYSLGIQMVEFDLRLTADKVLILHHDDECNGFKVEKTNFLQLKKIKNIDTLEQVLEWLSLQNDKRLKINIELKSNTLFFPLLELKTCVLVDKFKLIDQTLISSFNPISLAWVRIFKPQLFRALLFSFENFPHYNWQTVLKIFFFISFPNVLNLRFQDWDQNSYMPILKKGVPVVLWTCNDIAFSKKALGQVHGVISDVITPINLLD